ncbi:gfo/Idh/MocA family oxidoreductase, partial [Paenibacillus sepulcri]|nr:gfo/Idh/MocA family oxidoreductase [Paenibacillus sepulcri]
LVRLFLGLPQSVNATFGYVSGKEVEDNAVATLRYENGAVGIVEAGFVNSHSPFSVEIHGTEGTLLYGLPDEVVRVRSNKLNKDEWVTIEMPARHTAAFDQWVEHIQNDTIAEENIGLAIDLTKLMEAANLSEAQKRQVKLSELAN